MTQTPQDPEKPSSSMSRWYGLGFELAAGTAGLGAVGYLVDRHYGTYPRWLLVGAVLGIVGGMYNLIRASLLASRDETGSEHRKTNGDKKN